MEKKNEDFFVHPTACIEDNVQLGKRSHVWHQSHIRESAIIGDDVSLGKDVFIDKNVVIAKGTRIQNGVSVYNGVNIKEWVFVGPNVTFTNDRTPRAGSKKWKISKTKLMEGCSIGAGSTIVSDVTVGAFSIIGAGSVLTESIPPFHLAYGLPARIVSKICACGETRLDLSAQATEYVRDCCQDQLKQEVVELAYRVIQDMT